MTTEIWYSSYEVNFTLDCNIFLLHYYEELALGIYPKQPSDYIDTRGGRNTKAPFETASGIKAELDTRLGQPVDKESAEKLRVNCPRQPEAVLIARDRPYDKNLICEKRTHRCDYSACWQLNRILGKLIIAELSWKQLEWNDLDREVKDGLLFISSGPKHRRQTLWQYRQDLRRKWKQKKNPALASEV